MRECDRYAADGDRGRGRLPHGLGPEALVDREAREVVLTREVEQRLGLCEAIGRDPDAASRHSNPSRENRIP